MDTHDLTAAYALHALDDVERDTYERHLAQCQRCREELAVLTESAAALAWAVESPPPPAQLRRRILDATGGDNVAPFRARARRPWQSIAAVAACAAIGLGVWATSEHNSLAKRGTLQVVALKGEKGMLARSGNGDAVLVVDKLPPAPGGMTYEAWVIPAGGKPHRAGLFDGGKATTMVKLTMRVPDGATVAATMEHDGGSEQPTSTPLLSAQV